MANNSIIIQKQLRFAPFEEAARVWTAPHAKKASQRSRRPLCASCTTRRRRGAGRRCRARASPAILASGGYVPAPTERPRAGRRHQCKARWATHGAAPQGHRVAREPGITARTSQGQCRRSLQTSLKPMTAAARGRARAGQGCRGGAAAAGGSPTRSRRSTR